MPVALIAAFAVSLAVHLALLFGAEFRIDAEPAKKILTAELRPMPKSLGSNAAKAGADVKTEADAKARAKKVVAKTADSPKSEKPVKKTPKKPRRQENTPKSMPESVPDSTPAVMNAPEAPVPEKPKDTVEGSTVSGGMAGGFPDDEISIDEEGDSHGVGGIFSRSASEPSPLPTRGRIRYRVDLGDREFEVGHATSEWTISDGHYHLKMSTETVGLAWLVKPYNVLMESRGRITPEGLMPETFSILRNGENAGENAVFDWQQMTLTVGKSATTQPMESGTQDLLSFNFQLGFMRHPVIGTRLPIATGKKYAVYQLERLGDEEIEIPFGTLRTLHLRAPGDNTTELWLAYDYLLLPVKIRYVDSKGESYVQVALQIQLDKLEDE